MEKLEFYSNQLERAFLTLDKEEAEKILTLALRSGSPVQIAGELVSLTLNRIGASWEEGKLALSQVYMSGMICEELAQLKPAFKKKLTLLGNLNGIEMRRWTTDHARSIVCEAIETAAPGGGFILSDNHGEIPFQVPDEVLNTISETVLEYGQYPILNHHGI